MGAAVESADWASTSHRAGCGTVAREVGHTDTDMITRIYGHVGQVRHRADVVGYRVDQHREQVEKRFGDLVTMVLSPQH